MIPLRARLQFEQFGADHLFSLTPVVANAHGPAIFVEDLSGLVGEFAQLGGIRPAEARLDAPTAAGTQEKLLGDAVGVGVFLIQVFLDVDQQTIDLLLVIDIDQELNVGSVLAFRRVDEQEAEAAAANKRRDVGDSGLGLDVFLDVPGEGLRIADMGAGRQKDVHHELRPGRGREEALIDLAESVERGGEQHDGHGQHGPAEAEGQNQQPAVAAEEEALVRIVIGGGRSRYWREKEITQERSDRNRGHPAQAERDQDDPE